MQTWLYNSCWLYLPHTSIPDQRRPPLQKSYTTILSRLKLRIQQRLEGMQVHSNHMTLWQCHYYFCIAFLQFLFLAGATEHPIQQHCTWREGQAIELYKTTVPPCPCIDAYKPMVHVMWTSSSQKGSAPNHVIPLLPLPCNSQGISPVHLFTSIHSLCLLQKVPLLRSALAFPCHQSQGIPA